MITSGGFVLDLERRGRWERRASRVLGKRLGAALVARLGIGIVKVDDRPGGRS